MKITDVLTDEEIEESVEGSSDVQMIRNIIDLVQYPTDTLLNMNTFSERFAFEIRGFIDEEEGSEEYKKAYNNNVEWGRTIAGNINEVLFLKGRDE